MQSGTSRSVQHRYRQGCGSTWWVLEGSMWSPAIFGQHPWNIMEPSYIGVQQKFLKTTEIPFMARIFPNSADIFLVMEIPAEITLRQKFLPPDFIGIAADWMFLGSWFFSQGDLQLLLLFFPCSSFAAPPRGFRGAGREGRLRDLFGQRREGRELRQLSRTRWSGVVFGELVRLGLMMCAKFCCGLHEVFGALVCKVIGSQD